MILKKQKIVKKGGKSGLKKPQNIFKINHEKN